jgi:hypothetical protein
MLNDQYHASWFHVNLHWLRLNPVGDHGQLVVTDGNRAWDVEVGVNDFLSCGDGHGGVVKGSAEIGLFIADMLETDERIVRCHLRVIAVSVRLRQAIKLVSANAIRVTRAKCFGRMCDMWPPIIEGRSLRSEDFEVRTAVGIEYLARGQH